MIVLALAALASQTFAALAPAPCVGKARGALVEPATLDELVDCQRRALDAATQAFADKHDGLPPDDAVIDQWQDAQRAETQDYIRRHPNRAGLSGKKPAAPDPAEEEKLKADLWEKSEKGKKGVTPEMSSEISEYLMKKQGSLSPDMTDLLEALQKDGARLSDDSMLKLKKAARAADGEGLDLGVDPKMKRDLLDPATDPAPSEASPTN